MTLTHLDLDRIEGLAGRLREAAKPGYGLDFTDTDKERADYWSGVAQRLRSTSNEAADSLTAMIAYIRELEGALTKIAAAPAMPWMDRVQLYEETARTALQRKTP